MLSSSPTSCTAPLQAHRRPSDLDLAARRFRRFWNSFRLTAILAVACYCILIFRHHDQEKQIVIQQDQEEDTSNQEAQEQITNSCAGMELLRNSDECYESFDLQHGSRRNPTSLQQQRFHTYNVADREWQSPYNALLSYNNSYFATTPPDDAAYTTRRTLQCMIGHGMNIVWDLEFENTLSQAYGSGIYGMNPNRTSDVAAACPRASAESSASLRVLVDCGFDVKTDAWDNPATEEDHEAIETCIKMAWSWMTSRVGVAEVEPWKDLCKQTEEGEVKCERDVFGMKSVPIGVS